MFVGNFEHSEYGKALRAKYEKYPNILIHNAIYDLDILYALRNNCNGMFMVIVQEVQILLW